MVCLLSFAACHFLCQLRENGERISDDTEVCDGEDGGVLVFVNGDDVLGTLHPGDMLNSSTDATGDIECRFDRFASLTDLVAIGQPASIDNSAGCAGGSATRRG